jgi:ribosomal protein S18 acetylase RimI-like enzyme
VPIVTTLRTATVHDLPGVYRVCLQTGLSGHDATGAYSDPDLLGHIWAGPYLVFPDAVAMVLQDDHGVAGYCVGVPDTTAFGRWVEDVWLPPLRDRYPPGSGSGADAALVERLHHPSRTDAVLTADHPAHLHIDLLPRVQGQGWGRRLMDAVTGRLGAAGAAGVHLGVDDANTAAQAFYRRLGFTEVRRATGARYFARSLERT